MEARTVIRHLRAVLIPVSGFCSWSCLSPFRFDPDTLTNEKLDSATPHKPTPNHGFLTHIPTNTSQLLPACTMSDTASFGNSAPRYSKETSFAPSFPGERSCRRKPVTGPLRSFR